MEGQAGHGVGAQEAGAGYSSSNPGQLAKGEHPIKRDPIADQVTNRLSDLAEALEGCSIRVENMLNRYMIPEPPREPESTPDKPYPQYFLDLESIMDRIQWATMRIEEHVSRAEL